MTLQGVGASQPYDTPAYMFIYVSNHDNRKITLNLFSQILKPLCQKKLLKFCITHKNQDLKKAVL